MSNLAGHPDIIFLWTSSIVGKMWMSFEFQDLGSNQGCPNSMLVTLECTL